MTECNEIATVMDIVSIEKASTIATNVKSTVSISQNSKKVRDIFCTQFY